MPLEGQWERQRTPLRRLSARERRVLMPVALLLLVTAAVVLFVVLDQGRSSSAQGCIDVSAPSTTGAATLHACGRDAARWCRSSEARGDDPVAQALRDRCRRAGYLG